MSARIMPISDLRRQASATINTLRETGDAVYITQHGRPAAVLVDYERYERLLARLEAVTYQLEQKTAAQESSINYTAHLAGLHQEVWDGVDTDTYLHQERDAWED